MEVRNMGSNDALLNEIKDTINGIRALMDRAYQQYSSLVDAVINDEITDINQIERIMDGLVDLGDDVRFIEIYRKLCRHVYHRYPQLVGEHVMMFRAQFESNEDNDIYEEVRPKNETDLQKKYKINTKGKVLIAVYALVIVTILSLIVINSRMLRSLDNSISGYTGKITELTEQYTNVNAELDYVKSDEVIIEKAEAMGMVKSR